MDGIIIIDKEKGWTSNDIVQKLKGKFHCKVGHTGTLDPLATGVLPILLGKGTLLSKYLINHDKEYIATIKLGQKTSTGDSEGEIIESKNVNDEMINEESVTQVLHSFLGKQKQVPPMYSAIKVNGKKLYEYARKGQSIDVKPRDIEIYDIKLVSISHEDKNLQENKNSMGNKEIKYKVSCSKGTYIRTLSENIAERLETVGFMKDLQRTKVGDFTIEQAVKIEEAINEDIKDKIITIEKFFEKNEKIELDKRNLHMFLNGVNLKTSKSDGIYRIYGEMQAFVGNGIVNRGKLKRDICV